MPMDELAREFLIESHESLDRMEECITELQEQPQDATLLAEIFRTVHTIKGTSGFLGFTRLEKLAHAGEDLLVLLRDGKLAADPPVIDGMLQLLDSLRVILNSIEVEGSERASEDITLIGQLEQARMQPVSGIFCRMRCMVRDLSRQLGRCVRLQLEGQEIELDKSLLEAIKDPLIHAVRNALDHGIELPEVRQAAGKDHEGTLKLRAVQKNNHVVIEVTDDGAGISIDKVRNKAIEHGFITAERAAQVNERDLLQLLFLPGFSTAAAVTHISGRGVGMDIIRTNIERLGGRVEIDSRTGKGTTLRLWIPHEEKQETGNGEQGTSIHAPVEERVDAETKFLL